MEISLMQRWENFDLKDEKSIYKAIFNQAYRCGFTDGYRHGRDLSNLWISTSESLPHNGQWVLVYNKYGYTALRYDSKYGWHGMREEDVVGWLPIPTLDDKY